jgi:hypothetical protein
MQPRGGPRAFYMGVVTFLPPFGTLPAIASKRL